MVAKFIEFKDGTCHWADNVPIITHTDDAPYVWNASLWRMCAESHPIPKRFYNVLLRHGLVEWHGKRVIPTALGMLYAERHMSRFQNWKENGRMNNPNYEPPKRKQSEGTRKALEKARAKKQQ